MQRYYFLLEIQLLSATFYRKKWRERLLFQYKIVSLHFEQLKSVALWMNPARNITMKTTCSSTTCAPSSARLAAKHLLPSIILWWKETRELDNVCGTGTERSITCWIRKACNRSHFGCSYRGIRKRILGDKHHEFQEVLPEIQRVNNSSDTVWRIQKAKTADMSAESSLLPQKGQALSDLF